MNYIKISNSKVNKDLYNFVNNEVIPGTDIEPNDFWEKFIESCNLLSIENEELINERLQIQSKIDDWLKDNRDSFDQNDYIDFLKSINYIVDEGETFKINTQNVDEEISKIAGPQLVVPIDNARYALNAANARWGSLYDAYYGTDAVSLDKELQKSNKYNPKRGQKVIEKGREFLNQVFKLEKSSWSDAIELLSLIHI